jgi:hypothetical protein
MTVSELVDLMFQLLALINQRMDSTRISTLNIPSKEALLLAKTNFPSLIQNGR